MSEECEVESVAPFELRYSLTRRQRLVPHLKSWGLGCLIVPLVMGLLLAGIASHWWAGLLALVWGFVGRGFFLGFLTVVRRKSVWMDLRVEANGLGVMVGAERVWLFLDGLIGIDQMMAGLWTLRHWNGAVLSVPADAITDAQLAYLRAAMERAARRRGFGP